MEKSRINLDIILPDIPDESDGCVNRFISTLEEKRGIERVHVVPSKGDSPAQLCFHYNPSVITISKVEQVAKEAGIALHDRFGHLVIEVSGVRHPRQAKIIEADLKEAAGIANALVSGTGFIQLEYNKEITNQQKIIDRIQQAALTIKHVEDVHQHVSSTKSKATHDHNEHAHSHGASNRELYFALSSGVFLALGFGASFTNGIPQYLPIVLYGMAYFFGGFYTAKEAAAGISKGEFQIDFLMLVAAIGAAILGEWGEGALLLFLFSISHSLEHYAMEKARKSIAALTELTPKTALLKTGDQVTEVGIDTLKRGDLVVIRPNTTIAADGVVVNGNSNVNQAPITGESMPVEKFALTDPGFTLDQTDQADAKHKVFAGSINGGEVLEIRVSRVATDSTIARLVKLVNEAQTQKSPTQNFADKLERYYVPAVLVLVVLLLFAFLVRDETFGVSFYRAMAVLVAASPCALAISTPSAVLSGVARAARGGVLVKGGRPLEELGSLSAIAFDKTGTLTEGKPTLTGVYPVDGSTADTLLQTAVAVEQLSDHPLAAAVVRGGLKMLGHDVPPATSVQAVMGRGVKAMYEGKAIMIGNKELFSESGTPLTTALLHQVEALEKQGNTTMLVSADGMFMGVIALMDIARAEAKATIAQLGALGIKKMIMLTGDNQQVANAIAQQIGLTEAKGNLLPEQKVQALDELRKSEQKIAMVGDGVNDAPAMAKSTVGIAMGAAGSDVALETADIALMADKLSNLPFAIGLSKMANNIIRQNLVISLGMVAVLIPLTLLGIASMGPAVIGHEGSTLLVVFNALRLLGYKK